MSTEWISRGRCHVFGSDIVHDNGIMDFKFVLARQTDPEILKPHLFETIDPDFAKRVQPGDFIIAGKRFSGGKAHSTGYIPMAALGLRVLCESTFERVLRGAANLGLPVMSQCQGITAEVANGELIEVNMLSGEVYCPGTKRTLRYPPLREDLRKLIESGGRIGLLKQWLVDHPEMAEPLEVQ
jgi:3-isopropylmalate/(R)-2-methylmalate dehydratase small subunit